MRSRFLAPLLCAALAGCGQPSQLVVGVVTNLSVQGQLDNVTLHLEHNGVQYNPEAWPISDRRTTNFTLPGSYNLYSTASEPPIFDVVITGQKGDDIKVIRTSSLQLETGKTNFFRMSLVLKCVEGSLSATTNCPEGFSCVEGVCKPMPVDPLTLTEYDEDRVSTIECDSGTSFLDSGSCSDTGGCQPLPIATQLCPSGQFCSEGTCYQANSSSPRSLELGERCDPSTETCRETSLSCAGTVTNDRARCRVKCSADADCATRRTPDAQGANVNAALARCTAARSGNGRECTYACNPLATSDDQCVSGTTCSLIDIDSATDPLGPDCISVRSSLVRGDVGASCGEVGSCKAGNACLTTTTTSTCRPICNNIGLACSAGGNCTALTDSMMRVSPIWGVCCPAGGCP